MGLPTYQMHIDMWSTLCHHKVVASANLLWVINITTFCWRDWAPAKLLWVINITTKDCRWFVIFSIVQVHFVFCKLNFIILFPFLIKYNPMMFIIIVFRLVCDKLFSCFFTEFLLLSSKGSVTGCDSSLGSFCYSSFRIYDILSGYYYYDCVIMRVLRPSWLNWNSLLNLLCCVLWGSTPTIIINITSICWRDWAPAPPVVGERLSRGRARWCPTAATGDARGGQGHVGEAPARHIRSPAHTHTRLCCTD